MLALRAFREFVRRWPDHSRANEVRASVANLERMMPELLQDLDLPSEQAIELAAQHETVQSLLTQGRYREVRQVADTILKRAPKFAPALNNLSLAQWSDGHPDQAIASAQPTNTEHSARLTSMFYHLVAVAAWRLGQEGAAKDSKGLTIRP